MINSETKRLCGRYLAENKDDFLKAYHIVMDVKETDKSYIMQLIEFNSRYSASHISLLFSKSKRVLLSKKRGGFSIKNWGDNTFTFYPFQAGIDLLHGVHQLGAGGLIFLVGKAGLLAGPALDQGGVSVVYDGGNLHRGGNGVVLTILDVFQQTKNHADFLLFLYDGPGPAAAPPRRRTRGVLYQFT